MGRELEDFGGTTHGCAIFPDHEQPRLREPWRVLGWKIPQAGPRAGPGVLFSSYADQLEPRGASPAHHAQFQGNELIFLP